MTQLNSAFIQRLKTLASMDTAVGSEDYMNEGIEPFADGDVDSAHSIGMEDGEILLAREMLTHLGIEWK